MHPVAASWQEWEAQSGPNRTDFRRFTCGERQGDTPEAASSCIMSQTLSLLEALQSGFQGSPVAVGLDEHGHEHWLGKIRVAEAVEEALILGEPVPCHGGNKLLFGQIAHSEFDVLRQSSR